MSWLQSALQRCISKDNANHFKGTGKSCSMKAHRGRLYNSNEALFGKLKRRSQISHSPSETSTSGKPWYSQCSDPSIKTVKNAFFWSTLAWIPIVRRWKDLATLNCTYRLFYNLFTLWITNNQFKWLRVIL